MELEHRRLVSLLPDFLEDIRPEGERSVHAAPLKLRAAASEKGLPINALIAQIDAERIATDDPPNLASAIRVWLYARLSNTRA